MGLRLHLIVLIIFLRASASVVARVEADTLLVSFEVCVRSLCVFNFQFFPNIKKISHNEFQLLM